MPRKGSESRLTSLEWVVLSVALALARLILLRAFYT